MEAPAWSCSRMVGLIGKGLCWNWVTHLTYALTATFIHLIQGDLCL